MNNENSKTIEVMLQEMKMITGENEAGADKVIHRLASEMAENILEDSDERAARQFLTIFLQMEEWVKRGMLDFVLEMMFVILRLFNYGEEAEMIVVITNTSERKEMFVEAFIQCGKEICRSYIE